MRRSRQHLVTAAVMLVIAGHAWDVFWKDEHWPFSSYPMFRDISRPAPFYSHVLLGVTSDAREVPLPSKSMAALRAGANWELPRYAKEQDAGAAHARQALADILSEYDAARRANATIGPPLVGLRFYELTYPWSFNPKADRATPERKLIFTFDEPTQGGRS